MAEGSGVLVGGTGDGVLVDCITVSDGAVVAVVIGVVGGVAGAGAVQPESAAISNKNPITALSVKVNLTGCRCNKENHSLWFAEDDLPDSWLGLGKLGINPGNIDPGIAGLQVQGLTLFCDELNGHIHIGILPDAFIHPPVTEEESSTGSRTDSDFMDGIIAIQGFIIGKDYYHVGEGKLLARIPVG